MSEAVTPPDIAEAVLSAILAGRIAPGTRLGEAELATMFAVSRTKVREALMRLDARGIVKVSARKGWFVLEPSAREAHEAYQARRVIETGLIHTLAALPPGAAEGLRRHIALEQEAIAARNVGESVGLLGDFHVILAEYLGNPLLVEILRDLTARTMLVSMLYQSADKAHASSHDHEAIVAALEAGEMAEAARLMAAHIDDVEAGLDLQARPDPFNALKDALSPGGASGDSSTPNVALDLNRSPS